MTENITEHFHTSREHASVAAARLITESLSVRLQKDEAASLMVTGGTGPARCYAELAASKLSWSSVDIVLSDERWVPPTDSNSNEKLIRDSLLVDQAKDARLLSIYASGSTPAEQCRRLNDVMPSLPTPFACALLGMGADGHFASLFPDASNLEAGLDIENADWCIRVETAASDQLRISMTLATILRSDRIVLLFYGEEKRDIYEQAKAASIDVPVARLLSQTRVPVHVFWAD